MMYSTEILSKVKQIELNILENVHSFCVKNNIKYSLVFGTMLGALRHNGFIPWDDDIDIIMLREDYEEFERCWKQSHPDGLILENSKTNSNYTQCITKIRKNHTCFLQESEKNAKYHTGIFIDIFVFDRVADTPIKQKKQIIYSMFYYLYTRGFPFDRGSKFLKIGCKFLLNIVPRKNYSSLALKFEKKLKKYNSKKSNSLVCYCTAEYSTVYFPHYCMDDLELVKFEDKEFYSSKYSDEMLKTSYGDYMQLPPAEERTWKHSPILIDFNHNYEEIHFNE